MRSFYHYLAESVKVYRYRVKAVVPMDDKFIETLKKALAKYDVQEVTTPKKTPIQKAPLDFRDFDSAEVYMIDVTTSMPASSYVLATELRTALKLIDKFLIVRGENEPRELEAEAIEAIHKDDTKTAILDDTNYEQEEQPKEVAFGDSYNRKLLSYLAQVKANAEKNVVPAIEEIKKVNKFNWLNKVDTTVAGDFNDGIDGVKPVHSNTMKSGADPEKPNLTGNYGNYDANVKRKS